ncbi:MAG: hypothetical protein IIB56_01320 [Planctomycetes bacterium]|nr:hypothetical protein [Planctomycetota bacterium]
MSKKVIYLISFVLIMGLVLTSVAKAVDPDLVGWWRLDEGSGTIAKDSSGNGNNGTLEGNPQRVAGKIGGALKFDGDDDQITLKYPLTVGSSSNTVAAWIKVPLAGTEGLDASERVGIVLGSYNDSPNTNWELHAAGQMRLWWNGGQIDHRGTTDLRDNTWHHITWVRDKATNANYMYIDGQLETTIATLGTDLTFNTTHKIGGDNRGSPPNFHGLLDDVQIYSRALTQEDIQEVMIGIPPGSASNSSPANKATDVPRDVVLSWTPGEFAAPTDGHKVYFGDNFNDVNDAIGGVAQGANSYTPAQRLDFGTTYYWRVDEVNAPPTSQIEFKGNVWQFTTEPIAYAIENITATASSSEANKGPENTINGSGLDANDLHSIEPTDMWLSGSEPNAWIEYELDKVYKLHQMWVWNSNDSLESVIGFGFKDVAIEYSVNGTDYTTLGTTHEFARAPGAVDYAHNTTIDFGGVTAKYVRLITNNNWGDLLDQYGLSEVRFFSIPVFAREPSPDSGATDVAVDVTLGFRAGREAVTHDVYLSTDEQAVIDGNVPVTTVTETNYGPLSLDLDTTYYWKINEVNEAETPTTWQGDIWNFTTHEFLVVDGFEDYNDYPPDEIWSTWVDGYGVPANGATVGYPNPDWNQDEHYVETTIVHGDSQAMPFFYSNTGGAAYSEGERTFAVPQDWTKAGVQTLTLWFHGTSGNTGQMYVKINGSKIPYDGAAGNIAVPGWQLWNIDLASSGLNLQGVSSLAIGIDGNGASGTLYIDDIRLYALAPAPPNEWRINAGSDDAEEHVLDGGMESLTSSDLELGYEGSMAPAGLQTIGCRWVGVPVPKGATITEAWVQFSADDINNNYHIPDVSVIIEGELSPNPATFSSTASDISSRPTTTAQVVWDIPQWMTVHAKGPEERTPDISSIIQEIVNQNGWAGSAIVLTFRDNPAKPSQGTREAESFNGSASEAPLLHISYQ